MPVVRAVSKMSNPTTRALWWALVGALFINVLVAHLAPLPIDLGAPIALLTSVFAAMTMATAVGTVVYRRRALAGPIQAGQLDPRTPTGFQKAFQPFIINLVLSESVGIYGLVLALLSGDPGYSVAFTSVALVLMYVHRPTAPDLRPPLGGGYLGNDPTPIG